MMNEIKLNLKKPYYEVKFSENFWKVREQPPEENLIYPSI